MIQNMNLVQSFLLILNSLNVKKHYLQVYLDICACKNLNKQLTDYLDANLSEN